MFRDMFSRTAVRNFSTIALTVGSLLIGSVPLKAEAASPHAVTPSSTCLEMASDGSQQWFGEWNPSLDALGSKLESYVSQHPAIATGVAYCSHYEGAAIFVTSVTPELSSLVDGLKQQYPKSTIEVHSVNSSISALLKTQSSITSSAGSSSDALESAPNIYTGNLDVTIDAPADRFKAAELKVVKQQFNGVTVNITRSQSKRRTLSSVRADTAPWTMGDELNYVSTEDYRGHSCSAGIPFTLNKAHLLLTAGHCTGSQFSNNETVVGSVYTTAYPGNSNKYGDWQLLTGSSYAHNVWSGAVGTEGVLPMNSARFTTLPNGQGLCSSGRTTGMVCRFLVAHTNKSESIEGTQEGHLIELFHNSDRDDGGWAEGDSGGPVFYNDGGGHMIAVGNVTGIIDWFTGRSYYATDLQGLKAWAPSITFG